MSNTLLNLRVHKSEYDRWIEYLRQSGYRVEEDEKGGMMETVQVNVYNPDGTQVLDLGATSFMDAQHGRRVYAVQMRVPNVVEISQVA